MKEKTAPKKTWLQTLRTLWVPLAIGVVTVAALAVVVGMVWKDYRTAMMDSQTRQMELVVQSTADSIRVLLEEYADRLDSIAGKAEASKAFRPTVARSDTIRDVWLENSNGEVIYSCYGISAVCDVLITRTEDISYWQYHSGDEHYLVMKKKAGGETACLVVDSTVMYQQLISEIHVGTNGYIMIKNDDNLVVMHPEAVQWGIKVVEGRQRIYQGKELDMSSLSELLRAQQEEESGTLDYYSYWWADPDLPRVHKISAFRHLDVGGSFWIVSAVVDYDDFYEPVQQSFVKVVLIFGGVALVLVLFMFQMFRLQERDRRSATEISDLKTLNQTLEELHRSEESLAHGQRLQMMGTLTGGIAHEFKQIYACEFFYDEEGLACWPKLDVNFTNKTQFVYRINKGVLDVSDDKTLNDSMPDDSKRVPFTNMIYMGDGLSDVPCMKMMRAYGGQAIAVYQASNRQGVEKLLAEQA